MDKYFGNVHLLQNTLLPYFCDEEPLKLINKIFYKLNYEKYLTHLQPHGIIEIYRDDGKLQERKSYKNGKLEGLSEVWYIARYIKCWHKDGKLNGIYEEWYGDDQLEIKTYKDGKIDGLDEGWYRNGQLRYKINYKKGIMDGSYEEWYNGSIFLKHCYKDGEICSYN